MISAVRRRNSCLQKLQIYINTNEISPKAIIGVIFSQMIGDFYDDFNQISK